VSEAAPVVVEPASPVLLPKPAAAAQPLPADSTDVALWERAVRAGDADAFEVLYDRHVDRVAGFVARRWGGPDVEDITAEVFLQAWRQRERIVVDSEAGLLPWLFGVARNLVREAHRGTGRRARLVDKLDPPTGVEDHAVGVADRDEHEFRVALARTALESLSEEDRAVLEMCLLGELTPTQASPVLGQAPSTVRSRLTRARRRLASAYRQLDAGAGGDDD
jgi:RNA polymerase sigma-70 factor (ECF subfamily)